MQWRMFYFYFPQHKRWAPARFLRVPDFTTISPQQKSGPQSWAQRAENAPLLQLRFVAQ